MKTKYVMLSITLGIAFLAFVCGQYQKVQQREIIANRIPEENVHLQRLEPLLKASGWDWTKIRGNLLLLKSEQWPEREKILWATLLL